MGADANRSANHPRRVLERRRPGALQLAVSMALLVLVLLVGATIVVARRADDPRRLRPAY